ncbi:MAG: zinc-ribbon domain-containing protein [Eggerthellaceae bacterium]
MGTHGRYPPTTEPAGRPRLPLLRRPQGAERLQRPEDDASQDREGVEQERNGDLKPTDAIANSNKRVWWKCEGGPRVVRLIANRARKGKRTRAARTARVARCSPATTTWPPRTPA